MGHDEGNATPVSRAVVQRMSNVNAALPAIRLLIRLLAADRTGERIPVPLNIWKAQRSRPLPFARLEARRIVGGWPTRGVYAPLGKLPAAKARHG